MGHMVLGDRISPAMLGCRVILLMMLIAAIQGAQSRPDFERFAVPAAAVQRSMRSIVRQCPGLDRRMYNDVQGQMTELHEPLVHEQESVWNRISSAPSSCF
jgi:hypothetical protein